MQDPGLIWKYSLDYNAAVAAAGVLLLSSPGAGHLGPLMGAVLEFLGR